MARGPLHCTLPRDTTHIIVSSCAVLDCATELRSSAGFLGSWVENLRVQRVFGYVLGTLSGGRGGPEGGAFEGLSISFLHSKQKCFLLVGYFGMMNNIFILEKKKVLWLRKLGNYDC